jgi:hypothetical protein
MAAGIGMGVLFLAGVVLALVHPSRGLQDRIAGLAWAGCLTEAQATRLASRCNEILDGPGNTTAAAGAAEELSKSITEIATHVASSSEVAHNAVVEVQRTVTVKFPWKADTWYHLKLRVENTLDGKVRARGKAWEVGQPEPAAWTIDKTDPNGNHRLAYVLLVGDATEDFLNHASPQPDFVPSNLYFTQNTLFAFSTDEWYGDLDVSDQIPGHAISDVAVGRLPAASSDEASALVDKVIAYETDAPRDDWRHRIILLADDENSSFKGACETQWTDESELIARFHAPNFAAIQKIYLTEYPQIAGVKPTARTAFLNAWNSGALLINYIGHGSSVQMADEQVFLASDVSQLVNGERLPLLMAFSCTIGDFANPAGKSLSEKLLLREGGGAITTVTASRETYPTPNENVCFSLFQDLFPARLGLCLLDALLAAVILGPVLARPFLVGFDLRLDHRLHHVTRKAVLLGNVLTLDVEKPLDHR